MADHFRPGSAAIGCSTVELSVSCKNLANVDVFSKSDPMCVLFVKETGREKWDEFGRTEIIRNNLNPEFAKKFTINYFFEERQYLKFEMYDADRKSDDLTKHDFIGRIEITLGEIVSVGRLTRILVGDPMKNKGFISVVAEEAAASKEEIEFHFEGKKLKKKDFFGKSDPYLAFYKVNPDSSFTVVHRTEVIKCTLNPTWQPFTIPVRSLCGGDHNRPIMIRCFDWNRSGEEDLIGEFMTTLESLLTGKNVFSILIKKKVVYCCWVRNKRSGLLVLKSIRLQPMVTFLDYVQAGTQLHCAIAIDFTASNGDPTEPTSLHYIHPSMANQYHRAISAVGEIIQDYDTDKLFPVLGFGAKLPDGVVSHEFFVNGHPTDPYCAGIPGVLDAYQQCLGRVRLCGPTNFANVINHVARLAAAKKNGSEYFILLIITDGCITDMAQTKEAIVKASTLPLSIIIVGVGDNDFDAMKELDADTVKLTSKGRVAARDIVQFVPFRDFIQGNPADMNVAKAQLARKVLAEVPDQFVSYMKKNKIVPGSWAVPPSSQN